MNIEALLDDFANRRQRSEAFDRLVELVKTDQINTDRFAEAAMYRFPDGGTFFDLALGHVSRHAFERFVTLAIESLCANSDEGVVNSVAGVEAAESVIAYCSLQFPELLAPHLSVLFKLHPNEGTYYENWPWRGAGPDAQAELVNVIMSSANQDDRIKAWHCLLEIRTQSALADAISSANVVPIEYPVQGCLREVGYDNPGNALYSEMPWHLVFERDYFNDERPAWRERIHPTWNLSGNHEQCRFGGYAQGKCNLCAGPLHHLISFPKAFCHDHLGATQAISLGTCLSCLGWEKHFLTYTHDTDGLAQPIPNNWPYELREQNVVPQFPAVAFKEGVARLTAAPARWRWQDWALSNGRENLNRVGGFPSWVQSAEIPECPSCRATMRFLLQLDSGLPCEDGEEWLWGSGGICYGFWCAPCQVSGFYWQCT